MNPHGRSPRRTVFLGAASIAALFALPLSCALASSGITGSSSSGSAQSSSGNGHGGELSTSSNTSASGVGGAGGAGASGGAGGAGGGVVTAEWHSWDVDTTAMPPSVPDIYGQYPATLL